MRVVAQEARAHAYSQVEALLAASTSADDQAEQEEGPSTSVALSHHLVVVDDNMYYRSMRHRVFQLARSRARPVPLGQRRAGALLGGRALPSTSPAATQGGSLLPTYYYPGSSRHVSGRGHSLTEKASDR